MVHFKRHLLKAFSYRVVGTAITVSTSYVLGNNIYISGGLLVVDFLVKPFIYFFHERMWYTFSNYGVTNNKKE